jgi:hypothetical protein
MWWIQVLWVPPAAAVQYEELQSAAINGLLLNQ